MNSGSAPHTTRSSTTMPTRSKPIVSWTSIACAIATLVPTPSVEVASSGRVYDVSAEASNSPAKPPMPPVISGRPAISTETSISSTARPAASIETPASAYASGTGALLGVVQHGQRLAQRGRSQRGLEQVLAEQARVGQGDRVLAGEAGLAQRGGLLVGGLDHPLERDVAEAVGPDAGADLLHVQAVGDELGPGGE